MSKVPLTPDEIREIERLRDAGAAGALYDLLGVPSNAARADIDAAFRDRVRTWHPDRFYKRDAGSLAEAIQENFVHINQAYKLLIDEARRAAYHRDNPRAVSPPSSVVVNPPEEAAPSSFEVRMERRGDRVSLHSNAPTQVQAPPPKAPPPRGVERVRQQLAEQFGKARAHFQAGQAEAAAGNWVQAESTLYLATRYDPKNATYAAAYQVAVTNAKRIRAVQYLNLADQAESVARVSEAIEHLRKAVECDPAEGTAFFRLGKLLAEYENDRRGAVDMLRRAVQKSPEKATWRMALAELYESLGLRANALRETRALLELEPKNDKAKAMLKRLGA